MHIYGTKWALRTEHCKVHLYYERSTNIEKYKVHLFYEMRTTHWKGQGNIMIRIEHYTVKRLRYIYGKIWALNSEKCKVCISYEFSTAPWTV